VVDTSGVLTEEQVITPLFISSGLGLWWALDMRLARVAELLFLAHFFAVRAVYLQHPEIL
jgi:hypothetical protein